MSKSERKRAIIIFSALSLVFLIGAILTGGNEEKHETVQEVMRDSVLHDLNKISLLGIKDVNGAIMMGCLSYLVIMSGGIAGNGVKGIGKTLKDFSLPISMSFRLFGALLSGALVTELVYYYSALSYVLPVIVGVLFTLLHALIQAYVLTMLTSMFYGEVSEKIEKPPRDKRRGPKRVTVVKQERVR